MVIAVSFDGIFSGMVKKNRLRADVIKERSIQAGTSRLFFYNYEGIKKHYNPSALRRTNRRDRGL